MGKKGINALVTPEEFRSRTSLRLSSRSGTTLKVDAAYDAYYRSRAESDSDALHEALREYVTAHGGYWLRCERDKVSGGLLEWLYNFTAPRAVPTVPTEEEARSAAYIDRRAQQLLTSYEIPRSRFGVLYLLGNVDIDLNMISIGLEGVAAVGGAIGSGFSTDMTKLHSKDSSFSTGMTLFGKDVSAQSATTGGAALFKVAPKVVPKFVGLKDWRREARMKAALDPTIPLAPMSGFDKTVTPRQPQIIATQPQTIAVPVEAFPTTVDMLTKAAFGLSDAYNHGRYYGHAAAAGMLIAAPVALTGSVLIDAGRKLYQLGEKMFRSLYNLVVEFKDYVWTKLVAKIGMSGQAGTLALIVKAATKFLVDVLMKSAAPMVGAVMDVAQGVARTFEAVRNRVGSYLDRKKIRLVAGHPEEIANSIESAMNQGILSGLVDILKGVGKAAVQAALPGLGNLLSAVVTGVEWLVKFIYRLVEAHCIKGFLEIARGRWEIEKKKAKRIPPSELPLGHPGGALLEPDLGEGSFLLDTKEFTDFYRFGCECSPLIAMLTLNSGICGSLMVLARMFDDSGAMIRVSKHGEKKKEQFDIAGRYFTRLKHFGSDYLKASGFKFRAREGSDRVIQGLLTHAIEGHKRPITALGSVGAFLRA